MEIGPVRSQTFGAISFYYSNIHVYILDTEEISKETLLRIEKGF